MKNQKQKLAGLLLMMGAMSVLSACVTNMSNENAKEDNPNVTEVKPSETPGIEINTSYSEIKYDFSEIISKHKDYLNGQEIEDMSFISVGVTEVKEESDNPLSDVGYVLEDITGDGKDEMIVLTNDGEDTFSRVLAIYTIDNEGVSMLVQGAARGRVYILNDNKIYSEGSEGADSESWKVGYFDKDGMTVFIEKNYYVIFEEDKETVFFNTTGEWKYNDEEKTDISLDEYFEEADEYIQNRKTYEVNFFE